MVGKHPEMVCGCHFWVTTKSGFGMWTNFTFLFDESSNTDNKRKTGPKRKLQNCYIVCYRLDVLSCKESILLVIKINPFSMQYFLDITRNKFSTFNRSLFSIYKKCANLCDNTKTTYLSLVLLLALIKKFSACLHAYSVHNVTDSQTLSVENVGYS